MKTATLSALVAFAVAGCSSVVVPTSSSPSAGVSPARPSQSTVTVSPSPSTSASADPTLSPTQSPIAGGTDLERSDLFWDALISGSGPGEIESLRGGFREADLVVVGRFAALAFGDELFGFPIASSTITIDEVLKGRPETPVEGTITLRSGPVSQTQLLEQLMPTRQHLLFLWYVPSWLERLNRPPEEQAESRYHYQLMHGGQAVVRDIAGTARVLDARNPERFPSAFEGKPFDVVLETARLAAPAAAPDLVSIEKHDRLWDPFMHFGPPQGMGHRAGSVSDLTALADLIVLGAITKLYIGELWKGTPSDPGHPKPYLKVKIREVLKGKPVSRTDGVVEVMFGLAPDDFEEIQAGPLPEGEYLWFLIHDATELEELGAPPRDSEIAPYSYYPPAGRGVLLNDDGLIGVVLAERLAGSYGEDFFPLPLRGENFQDVLAEVRDLVAP